MNIVIDFGCLYYKDFSIIKGIQDIAKLKKDLFINSDKNIVYQLLNRQKFNPLSLIMEQPHYDIESLYNEFISGRLYDVALHKYEMPTQLIDFIKLKSMQEEDKIVVLCKNSTEQQFIIQKQKEGIIPSTVSVNLKVDEMHKYDLQIYSSVELIPENADISKTYYIAKTKYNVTLSKTGDGYVFDEKYKIKPALIELFTITQEYKIYG